MKGTLDTCPTRCPQPERLMPRLDDRWSSAFRRRRSTASWLTKPAEAGSATEVETSTVATRIVLWEDGRTQPTGREPLKSHRDPAMNVQEPCRDQNRGPWPFPAGRRTPGRRSLIPLSAMLIACTVTWAVRGQAADGAQRTPSPSWAEAFPELAAACQPIGRFLFETTIVAGEGDQAGSVDAQRPWKPFSAGARMVAYEENDHFICATGEAPLGGQGKAVLVRRLVFLRPSLFIIDDFVRRPSSDQTLRWQLRCRGTPTVAGRQYRVADGEQELVCETLWAATQSLQEC